MFAVFVAAEAAMIVVSVVVLAAFGATTLPALLTLLVVPPVLAALVAVGGTSVLREQLGFRWSWKDLGIGLAFGVGGLALTLPAAAVWASWAGSDATSAVGEAFTGQQLPPLAAVLAFLAVWLVAPLSEEIMFRGALWRALELWGWNRWLVFAVTSVAFSLAHLELLRTPLLLVLSIPIGLARLVTGNVLASVVAHQVNNFLPALALFFYAV